MKTCQYLLWSTLLALCCIPWMNAQQNTVAAGGEASGSGGSISYSVGQIDYQSVTDNDGIISEGVQHAYEIYITTDVENPHIQLSADVYPNPTMDRLTLSIEQVLAEDLHFSLFSNDGKRILLQKVTSPKHEIRVADYPEGIYFLKVGTQNSNLKTFKIIKKR